jgi:bacillolysin
MKKSFILLTVILVGFIFCSGINAQYQPFSAKKRTAISGKIAGPQNMVSAVPYKSGTIQGSRFQGIPSYLPSGLNLSSLYLDKSFHGQKFDQNGQLIFLEGSISSARQIDAKTPQSLELASFEYLEAIRKAMRIENPQEEFRLAKTGSDELGMDHIKLQQVYKGIPVWCAEVYLHSRQGKIDLFNGRPYPTPSLTDLSAGLTSEEALQIGLQDIRSRTTYREFNSEEKEFLAYDKPLCELVIYHKDRDPLQAKLAWHLSMRPNLIEQWEYFVDAHSGEIIHFYNNTRSDGDIPTNGTDLNGVNRDFHVYLENGVYLMIDVSRPMFNPQTMDGAICVYDAQNTNPANENFSASLVSSYNNTWEPTAVSAIYNAQSAYEYFRTVHDRNSYNNEGGAIKSIIHVGAEDGGGWDNAYWNGIAVFYGDGGTKFKPLAGGLDVGSHECGHAFEGSASNLEYEGQSGAISESYADYSGAMVDRGNWTIGEQIVYTNIYPSGCLRNMADPHNGGTSLDDKGYQPAHMNELYTGTDDNGGVHINSGIGNKAYYLTANAIGKEKTEKIFFRACFFYNTRSTQFIDFRLNVLQAAKDLFGDNSTEAGAVADAFSEVGIGDGQGGDYESELQVNPGQDYILFYDEFPGDPTTLYVCSTAADNFIPLTETEVSNKPSVVDDGSYAVFISGDHKMRSVLLDPNPNETIIEDEAIWHNVAVSKDGNRLSATTIYQDSAIWVWSYQLQEWMGFHLYNATTAQGEESNTVIYSDIMEWDYSGEYIMYDALSRIDNPYGDPIENWDINFIKVWDNASNYWGDGQIYKIFGSLPAGINVGNPSFSKNSPNIFAFDLLDANTNIVTVGAANFETGDLGEIFTNQDILGTPNYSKLDDKVIFTVPDGSDNTIAIIDMQSNKILPATGDAYVLITQAKWGIWFSQGTRPLLEIPELKNHISVRIYPNPTTGIVNMTIDPAPQVDLTMQIFDSHGASVRTYHPGKIERYTCDLTGLPAGLYVVEITGLNTLEYQKILIR